MKTIIMYDWCSMVHVHVHVYILYFRGGMVRSQKQITGLFGNFSQVAAPPLPHPLFWEPLIRKKNYRLFCILGP